jgi:pimeloyl-ACP methyl ester carboxylesterase
VRELGIGPVIVVGYSMGGPISMLLARRHPDLVAGLVVQATALDWKNTRKDRILWRILPIAGSWLRSKGYRRYLNRAVPKVIGIDKHGADVAHPVRRFVPWLVSEMSRNDPFVMVEAGRALADYDAREWAGSLGVPAACLVTTADRFVRPRQQRALAAALGATTRELRADHFATLSHPREHAALTVELIVDVRQRLASAASASGVA